MGTYNFMLYSLLLIFYSECVRSQINITHTLSNLTLSEGATYSLDCSRPSTDYTLLFVKFDIFLNLGPSHGSGWVGGPYVLSNEDVLDEDIEEDSRYNVERKTDLEFVFTLTGVEWLDQGTFGCRAYQNWTGGSENSYKQKVTIPGPLTGLELIEADVQNGTQITEEIRVQYSDPFKQFFCRINTTNALPPTGFDIQINGETIYDVDFDRPLSVFINSILGNNKRFGQGTYSLVGYRFFEQSRRKDQKSVYTCFTPTRDGRELRASFTVALEYEPENIDNECTQLREQSGNDMLDHIITCRIRAYPFGIPLWTVGREFINTTAIPERYELSHEGSYHNTSFSLRIFNITQSDYKQLEAVKFQAINKVGFSRLHWIDLDEDAPISDGNTIKLSMINVMVLLLIAFTASLL